MKALGWSQDIILNNWTAYVISSLKKSLSDVENKLHYLSVELNFHIFFKNEKHMFDLM